MASHDLKAPLSRILMLHQLLKMGEEDPEKLDVMSKVSDQISEMGSLIDSLLTYAKALNKSLKLEKASLRDAIEIAYECLEEELMDAKTVLEIGSMPTITYDSVLITQVFQNLLSNSLTYNGGKSPEIDISSETLGDHIRVCFKDQGMGLKPGQDKLIFKAFRRFVSASDISGSGIGMAICQKNILRHSGEIWVESEGEGKGLSVYFQLPIEIKQNENNK